MKKICTVIALAVAIAANAAIQINVTKVKVSKLNVVGSNLQTFGLYFTDEEEDEYVDGVYIYSVNTNDIVGTYSLEDGNLSIDPAAEFMYSDGWDFINDMQLTITKKGNTYTFIGSLDGILEDGEYQFRFSQVIDHFDSPYNYDFEPATITTLNLNPTEMYFMQVGYGKVQYTLCDGDYDILLNIFTSLIDPKQPAGTYNIDFSGEEGTVEASPGGDDSEDYGSFVAFEHNALWFYSAAYYLVSGTVTISYDENDLTRIVVAAKTAKGSTINATYQEQKTDGLDHISLSVPHNKILHNGHLFIQKDGHLFNALGVQLR